MPSRLRRSSSATACCGSRPGSGGRGRRAAGFSLLEVIVALAILGIGLGVVFQGIGQGLRLRAEGAENLRLALVAETVLGGLAEREAAPETPEGGEATGCRWRLETLETHGAPRIAAEPAAPAEQAAASLAVVRLTVTAPSGRNWEMFSLLPVRTGASP